MVKILKVIVKINKKKKIECFWWKAGSGKWEVEGEAEKKYTSKELGYKLFLE